MREEALGKSQLWIISVFFLLNVDPEPELAAHFWQKTLKCSCAHNDEISRHNLTEPGTRNAAFLEDLAGQKDVTEITLDSDDEELDPLDTEMQIEDPPVTEADMELADENDDPLGMDGEEVECSPDIGMDVEDVECSPDNVEEETLKISEVSSLAEEKGAEPHETEKESSEENGGTSPIPCDTTKENEAETCSLKTGGESRENQGEIKGKDSIQCEEEIGEKSTKEAAPATDQDEGSIPDENEAQLQLQEPDVSFEEELEKSPTSDNETKQTEEETTGSDFVEKQSEDEMSNASTGEREEAYKSTAVATATEGNLAATPSAEHEAQPQEKEKEEVSEERFEKSSIPDNTTKETEEETCPQDAGCDFSEKESENEVVDANMDEEEEAGGSTDDATPEASDNAGVS